MSVEVHTPKFRSMNRLVDWVRRRGTHQRLPEDREQIFLTGGFEAARHLVKYSMCVGYLGEELEKLLLPFPQHVVAYAEVLGRSRSYSTNHKLAEHLHPAVKGNGNLILRLARHLGGRVGQDIESSMSDPGVIVRYAEAVGPLDESLERIICQNHDQILQYGNILARNERKLPEWMMDELKGDDSNLYILARSHIKSRLPKHLEDSMSDPRYLFEYSLHVLHDRLPEHLEKELVKGHAYAVRYAFEVVRGFSSVRLPDEIHSMLVMKSFELPDDNDIKRYIRETERTGRQIPTSV